MRFKKIADACVVEDRGHISANLAYADFVLENWHILGYFQV